MRIVIDIQGAQSTGNRNRGIGRYTLALAKEMTRQCDAHEVLLVLNGLFPETIELMRAAFASLLPQDNICVWEAAGPVYAVDQSNDSRRQIAEITREAFLASLQPDVVLNMSIFEGLGEDDAITSIGVFTSRLPTAVVLYDLIPLIHRSIYLENPVVERWYQNKLDQLRRADLLLAISGSSAQEAVDYLGFPSANVVNISAACDSQFQPLKVDETTRVQLHKTYGLIRPFVMYTGGIDHRKNIEGLIRAYARLPKHLRAAHQLAVVCAVQQTNRERLRQLADEEGLADDELVMTGFVPEEDLLALYNACKLFIFPSWHEGFGLPALEAMACGRAVIGANTSSIPEVIGRRDALFDPFDDDAIARKILEVLTNSDFRKELEQHGLEQAKKFSWEDSARRAWQALDAFVSARKPAADMSPKPRRPRLAYFSPLPPEKSGISDYSAELLPELARHYEIEVIVAQKEVSDGWVLANCPVRDVAWFRQHADRYDRVMYHFGNSEFHSHMFDLLREFPGVVVLHDFFLAGIVAHMDVSGIKPYGWARALIYGHGWTALQSRYKAKDTADVVWAYPCNLEVLQQALGVIVHSGHSGRLAENWFGHGVASAWSVIPLLRAPAVKTDRQAARQNLGLVEKDFIVCSFGHLGPAKLNQRLLSAWQASPMALDPHCHLVFVGQNQDDDYGAQLVRTIRDSVVASPIKITGWTDAQSYRTWLTAADVGVQLRTLSRGETSAAVLDCMNHGLATVVNANGSMADLPQQALWMMPDEFSDDQLILALTTLWRDMARRTALGQHARNVIQTHHRPRQCAEHYAQAIECSYQKASVGLPAMFDALAKVEPAVAVEDISRIATALAKNAPPRPRRKQLLLDISELVQKDSKSGIQRVVRALLQEFLLTPPTGWAVEPVYASGETTGYRYARRFTSRFLDVSDDWAEDAPVEAWPGDVFLGLDLQHFALAAQKDHLHGWHRRGIKVFFVVYDLLPVLLPHVFPAQAQAMHQRWLETLTQYDGAMCISRAVADELCEWMRVFGPKRARPFALHWFHLGADVQNTVPTTGVPANAELLLNALNARPSFLMVGTLEPRKGHTQTLDAFEQLWHRGNEANLVIVGKQGWMVETLVERLSNHCELGKRLFWLEGISDEYLEKVYAASSCLIAASEGEGFGLPLVEAAEHKLPIIARDIPVFREVAGDYAHFFPDDKAPEALASAVQDWMSLCRVGAHPRSDTMPWLTWKTSAQQLLGAIMGGEPYKTWLPDGIQRYWGNDPRLHTQVGERSGQAMRTTRQAGFLVFGPYASFGVGTYQMQIKGKAHSATIGCWLDVSCDSGGQRMLYKDLPEANLNNEWMMTTDLVLDHAVKDLEMRVWVPASAELTVESIVLVPAQRTQLLAQDALETEALTAVVGADPTELPATLVEAAQPSRKKNKKARRR